MGTAGRNAHGLCKVPAKGFQEAQVESSGTIFLEC